MVKKYGNAWRGRGRERERQRERERVRKAAKKNELRK